jgi:hypothetical protein
LTDQGHPIVEETRKARVDVDSDDGMALSLSCSVLWLILSSVEAINDNNGIALAQEKQHKLTDPRKPT